MSKSAADRIVDHLGLSLALQQRKRFRKDSVLIVDGTQPQRLQGVALMETWKILRYCRLKGDGVHNAMLGIARLYNLTLAG